MMVPKMKPILISRGKASHLVMLGCSLVMMNYLSLTIDRVEGGGGGGAVAGLFIFGDSLYDNGNNNHLNTTPQYQANFWPYGETFFNYPTGRFSNGRLMPDFIAEYAKLPLIPSYLQPAGVKPDFTYGANFASSSSGALDGTYPGMVINLNTQLRYFKNVKKELVLKLGDKKAKQLLSNSVYLISTGGNDYLSDYGTNSSIFDKYTQHQLVDMVISNISGVVKEIYKEGGRKFGFLTLPPLDCLPSMRDVNGDCIESVTAIVQLHNKAITNNAKMLKHQLQGFIYSVFDLNTCLSERLNNPSKYGFEEGKTACCGSGQYRGEYSCGGKRGVKEFKLCNDTSKYLFFDANHASEKGYKQLARLMWSAKSPIAAPINYKSLFKIAA